MSNTLYKKNPEQAAVLKILNGTHKGKQFRLIGSRITIGRSNDCDIVLKDNTVVSREHAIISFESNNYFIKSLTKDNPVLVDGKKIDLCHLQNGNEILLGNMKFRFENQSPLPSLYTDIKDLKAQQNSLKKSGNLNPMRLILIGLLFFGGFLFLSDNKIETEDQIKLKTQQEVEEELTVLKKIYSEEKDTDKISEDHKVARTAFIKGFRDYRKGYFQRAIKSFRHCLALDKSYSNCHRYIEKSNIQIEKLIQKKMLLGKRYKQNKQYSACKAIFKSVTIMVKDTSSLIYKEALLNRDLCSSKTKNKL